MEMGTRRGSGRGGGQPAVPLTTGPGAPAGAVVVGVAERVGVAVADGRGVADEVARAFVERASRVDGVVVGSAAGVSAPAVDGSNTRPTDVPGVPAMLEPFTNSTPVTTSIPSRKTSAVTPNHRPQGRGGGGAGRSSATSGWPPAMSR